MSVCYWRRKKPPPRNMSKRNLQGDALKERLKRREENIERQRVLSIKFYLFILFVFFFYFLFGFCWYLYWN